MDFIFATHQMNLKPIKMVFLEAIKNNDSALFYASQKLQNNKGIVFKAIKKMVLL